MSKLTCIYVLFKEYADASTAPSAPYVNGEEYPLGQGGRLNNELGYMLDVLGYFAYEHCHLFYDQANLNGLLRQPNAFPDEDYPSLDVMLLAQFQELGMITWSDSPVETKETFKYEGFDVTHTMFGDMSQREINRMETLAKIADPAINQKLTPNEREYEPCVLLHHGAVTSVDGQIDVSRTGQRQIVLNTVSNIPELHAWISENRFPKRQYNYNPKHGDANHKAQMIRDRNGSYRRAAQLLTTTEETNVLLKLAVGRNRESELWYYDDAHGCHIYFENQGKYMPPSFHAYHLHPGDENYDNIDMDILGRLR
jgi:hypothetical protein